jgi:hypothetical protein
MVGPTTVSIEELELEDQVKVVGNDGSFEAVIKDASPEEGITFKRLSDGGFFVIAFEDFIDYDLYPKGETIRKIADRKRAIQEAENSFAQKEQVLEKSKTFEETQKEDRFFILFDKFQNLSLGDQHEADVLISEMKDLAHGEQDLTEALGWLLEQRIQYLEEAAVVSN